MDSLMTTKEVSQLLRLSTKSVRALVAAGDIPAIRIGRGAIRYDREAIRQWLERHAYNYAVVA